MHPCDIFAPAPEIHKPQQRGRACNDAHACTPCYLAAANLHHACRLAGHRWRRCPACTHGGRHSARGAVSQRCALHKCKICAVLSAAAAAAATRRTAPGGGEIRLSVTVMHNSVLDALKSDMPAPSSRAGDTRACRRSIQHCQLTFVLTAALRLHAAYLTCKDAVILARRPCRPYWEALPFESGCSAQPAAAPKIAAVCPVSYL